MTLGEKKGVKGTIGLNDAIGKMEQFPHDGGDNLHFGFVGFCLLRLRRERT